MTTQTERSAGWRKIAVQAVTGAVIGAFGMVGVLALLDRAQLGDVDASHIVLIGIGFIYVLMGAVVGLGALAPRLLGQRMLNVADVEEIIEERGNLTGSALGCAALGLGLMLLAYATIDGGAPLVPAVSAFWLLMLLIFVTIVVSVLMWRRFDELWRQLTIDASAIGGNLMLAASVVWGSAAATGLMPAPHPLDLVSLAAGAMLLATFIAAGRRGMMAPR